LEVFEKIFMGSDKKAYCTTQEIEAYKYVFSKPGGMTCPVNWYRATTLMSGSCGSLTGDGPYRITVPTLVIWGKLDTALSPVLSTGCSKYVDNFNFRLIEDGGHFIQTEKPELVNKYIREYLSK
jgi:pimeloyl-ACP methyl ester carboxylesterase